MPSLSRSNLYLGLVCLAFAALVAFVWVPLDATTGLVEKIRNRLVIGDGLAPTVAAVFVGLGGALLALAERKSPQQGGIARRNLLFLGVALGIVVAGVLVMRYAGPAAVALLGGERDYRLLRDTTPWKHIGFVLGGVVIVGGLIAQIEGRFRPSHLWIGLAVVLMLILLYDLPFDDLLLPPNGDV
ncbi:MAG: hypothetical protein GDA40_09600 [Rhodobacteraceae bacterium]|nr:hypothetical protein [Paracoccaceae bacterium]